MKRDFNTLYARNEQDGYRVGDEAAHRAAAALGDKADAPTIQALTYMLDMAEIIGGQFHVTAYREKFDRYGNRIEEGEGKFETLGLDFHFETRDVKVEPAEAPDSVLGLPVTDSHAPATQVEVGQPELMPEALLAALTQLAAEDNDPGEEEPGEPGLEEFERTEADSEVEQEPVAAE